jgi:hypothetical protein
MKVRDAIELLENTYSPDDDIFMLTWDVDNIEGVLLGRDNLTKKDWPAVIESLEQEELDNAFEEVHQTIVEIADKINGSR